MIGIEQATRNLLGEALFVIKSQEDEEAWPGLREAATALQQEIANIDKPDHVCPLCAQPKNQVELMKFIKALKSCEVWADDGQSWTIDVASFEGNPDEIVKAMVEIVRGEYEGEYE